MKEITIDGRRVYLYVLIIGASDGAPHWLYHEQLMSNEGMRSLIAAEIERLGHAHDAALEARDAFIKERYTLDADEHHLLYSQGLTRAQLEEVTQMMPAPILAAAVKAAGFVELERSGYCESYYNDRQSGWYPSRKILEDLIGHAHGDTQRLLDGTRV